MKGKKMQGIYRTSSEDSFVSDEDIKQELAQRDYVKPEFPDYKFPPTDWKYWNDRFKERARVYQEGEENGQNVAVVNLPPNRDHAVVFQSDTHAGNPHTMYDEFERECDLILKNGLYTIWGGDLLDSFFWPETAINDTAEQIPAQYYWFRTLAKRMGDHLLAIHIGNHDAWTRKAGISFHTMLQDTVQVPVFYGTGYLKINIGNTTYYGMGNHNFCGSSYLNKFHQLMRAVREQGMGIDGNMVDFVYAGHTHDKAAGEVPFQGYEGEGKMVTLLQLGCYKKYDSFGNRIGVARKSEAEMYGSMLMLRGDGTRKQLYAYNSVDVGLEVFQAMQDRRRAYELSLLEKRR